ncbi:MAG: hypothetical protein ABEI80_02025 [Haloplanus sp.]
MSDERLDPSRRRVLKAGGLATAGGLALYLLQDGRIRGRVAERGKGVAEVLRAVPGFGYGGRSVELGAVVGRTDVLTAEKDEPGYWRGAPAMAYDGGADRILTHVRHRDPDDRGKRVSIHRIAPETLEATELVSLDKRDLGARSVEGGELVVEDGEYRWFISYQHPRTGNWRIQERRASTVEGLQSGGADLDVASAYAHTKDPAIVNGEFHVISTTRNWLHSRIERVDVDRARPTTRAVDLRGVENARLTSGGLVGNEVFVDAWPNFPGTDISNFLWTTDERSATGELTAGGVRVDTPERFVSASGTSVTYVDGLLVDGTVYLLWQEERRDGSNDLVGTRLPRGDYERLVGVS